MIIWEQSLQVTDGVIEESIEDIAGLLDNSGDITGLLELNKLHDVLELSADTSAGGVGAESSDEDLRSLEEFDSILSAGAEERVKLITSPLNAMLDLIREVSKGAHRDGLLRRVLRVTISLSLVGHNHLGVGLGAEGARLEERLLVPDALRIDIKSCLDVINSVNDEVERLPEVVVKEILGLR